MHYICAPLRTFPHWKSSGIKQYADHLQKYSCTLLTIWETLLCVWSKKSLQSLVIEVYWGNLLSLGPQNVWVWNSSGPLNESWDPCYLCLFNSIIHLHSTCKQARLAFQYFYSILSNPFSNWLPIKTESIHCVADSTKTVRSSIVKIWNTEARVG